MARLVRRDRPNLEEILIDRLAHVLCLRGSGVLDRLSKPVEVRRRVPGLHQVGDAVVASRRHSVDALGERVRCVVDVGRATEVAIVARFSDRNGVCRDDLARSGELLDRDVALWLHTARDLLVVLVRVEAEQAAVGCGVREDDRLLLSRLDVRDLRVREVSLGFVGQAEISGRVDRCILTILIGKVATVTEEIEPVLDLLFVGTRYRVRELLELRFGFWDCWLLADRELDRGVRDWLAVLG